MELGVKTELGLDTALGADMELGPDMNWIATHQVARVQWHLTRLFGNVRD